MPSNQLGIADHAYRTGDLARAERVATRLLEDPSHRPHALHLLGLVHHARGEHDDALRCYLDAVELAPDNAEALLNAGLIHKSRAEYAPAADLFGRAHRLAPAVPEIVIPLAQVLCALARHAQAVAHLEAAVAAQPDHLDLQLTLAEACSIQGTFRQAISAFERALELAPDDTRTLMSLARTLLNYQTYDAAMAALDDLLRREPDNDTARAMLFLCKEYLCDWSELDGLSAKLRQTVMDRVRADAEPIMHPWTAMHLDISALQQRVLAEHWVSHRTRHLDRRPFSPAPRQPRERLRIGYYCSDFRDRASGYLMQGLFEAHDRGRFEVFAYSDGPEEDAEVRRHIRATADRFVDLQHLDPRQSASRINGDTLDILIDLSGGLNESRIEIHYYRPAPLQVSWLGHPGTIGSPDIDYAIVDEVVVPPHEAATFTECLAYLPGCYQINYDRQMIDESPIRADCNLPEVGFVFCCFNQSYKITPAMFACWARILDAASGSVLWLIGHSSRTNANLCRALEMHDVNPGRLVFAPFLHRSEHLARLALADLFLDTVPVNAHTTASDALYAGVPVLTCSGNTFVSRVGASLNTALAMPDMNTPDMAAYEAAAIEFATNPERAARLRSRLAGNRRTQPLFKTRPFVANLERCYAHMWAMHCDGRPPQTFSLTDLT